MKRLFTILACTACLIGRAQVVREKVEKPLLNKPMKLPVQQQPAAPAPAQKATPPATTTPPPSEPATDYYVREATVVLYTGNDNKELPSKVFIQLIKKEPAFYGHGGQTAIFYNDPANIFNNQEFKVNNATTIKLVSPFSNQYRLPELLLRYVQKQGLKLVISYHPNFPTDAWRVEKAGVVLRISDAQGRPHPTLDYRSIIFAPFNRLLNKANNELVLEISPALSAMLPQ